MQSDRHVARNFMALVSGEAVSRVIAFAVTVFIARVLGAEGYGVIAFAAGVNLYFSKLADFAVEWVGSREIAKQRDQMESLVAAVMGTRLVFVCLLTVLSILLVRLFMSGPERDVLALYLITMIPLAASTKWVHLGLEDARPIGLARVLGETAGLMIVLAVMMQAVELWVPPVAQVVSELLVALYLFIVLRRRGYRFGLSLDLKLALPVFRAGLPLVLHMLLGLFIYNSDLIFLRMFRDSEQVGYYAAAYTLISLVCNLGISYGMSLTPALTRLGPGSDAERSQYHTAIAQVFAVTVPISIGGALLAGSIILMAFGEQYSASVLALQILIWSVPLSICRNVPWAGLIARHREDLLLRAVAVGAAINILLNLLLIPVYGILGAAIATVITESAVGAIMLYYAAGQGLSLVELTRLWKPLVAGTVMGLGLWLTSGLLLPVALVVGVAIYAVCLALLGGIRFAKGRLPALYV
jgi:O-antigen/teichoic acid export membrane protein